MLTFHPKQEGVVCSNPTAEEARDYKVELVKGATGSGWALKDTAGNLVRRFYDTNGDNRIDVWSYFKDGVEVYRETDTTFSGKPDHYRWLNSGGSRWGIDQDRDGTIDTWRVISPEEVSQEVLRALVSRNFARLQALMISDTEIKALELPAAAADALRDQRKGAQEKFQNTISKLPKLTTQAVWTHLQIDAPQCIPADQLGSNRDMIRYARGTVLVEVAGANEWFQTGPMIQVGMAWRLVTAPAPGASIIEEPAMTKDGKPAEKTGFEELDLAQNPQLQKLIDELTNLDKSAAAAANTAAHHLARADLLEKVNAQVKPERRDPWIRQVADSLSSAAQVSPANDTAALTRLTSLEGQLVKAMPGTNLTAYVAYRVLQADYAAKISGNPKDFNEVQKAYMERLTKFVQTYPKGEDTPDALLQLGMVCEFLGKDVEAKNWYGQIGKNFAGTAFATKAEGAVRRLELEGKEMKLAAPQVTDAGTPYDIEQLRGKNVVVYYWASWNGTCTADFAKLKALMDANPDFAVLGVNLDTKIEDAQAFLKKNPAPGAHLYQPGGLEGALAARYGVMVLPSMFLVGKDGKVVNRTLQVGNLEDELKKLKK
jgi:thiol-disulfide isomerase/thioredoxin